MDIPDWPGDGVRLEGTFIRTVCESFIKIWHQELCQDSTCTPSLFPESRRTWTFLIDLEMVSDGREHPSEVSVKVSSRTDSRNHVNTLLVCKVSSWSPGGHGSGDGVRWEGKSIQSVCESFIKIRHQELCQDSTCPPSLFPESRRTWAFLMDLEMVSDES